jgi:hypothetical protein
MRALDRRVDPFMQTEIVRGEDQRAPPSVQRHA